MDYHTYIKQWLRFYQIDDFPPKKSIVVTPSKMAAYYASHALEKEPHPLLSTSLMIVTLKSHLTS
jgi:hypothetical protein